MSFLRLFLESLLKISRSGRIKTRHRMICATTLKSRIAVSLLIGKSRKQVSHFNLHYSHKVSYMQVAYRSYSSACSFVMLHTRRSKFWASLQLGDAAAHGQERWCQSLGCRRPHLSKGTKGTTCDVIQSHKTQIDIFDKAAVFKYLPSTFYNIVYWELVLFLRDNPFRTNSRELLLAAGTQQLDRHKQLEQLHTVDSTLCHAWICKSYHLPKATNLKHETTLDIPRLHSTKDCMSNVQVHCSFFMWPDGCSPSVYALTFPAAWKP